MFRRLKSFALLDAEDKRLLFSAFATLVLVRLQLLLFTFKYLTRRLKQAGGRTVPVLPAPSRKQMQTALKIGEIIEIAARYTPWNSTCLMRSMAAWHMLECRGIPGRFFLGVMRDPEKAGEMIAHSWSQCGDEILTGGAGREAYTVISVLDWSGK